MTTSHRRKLAAVVTLSVGAAVLALVPSATTSIPGDPRTQPVPAIVRPSGKAMVTTMAFRAGQAPQVVGTQVVFGRAPGLTAGPRQLDISVVARGGGVLQRFDAGDPLSVSVHGGGHSHQMAAEGRGTFIVPFDPRMQTLRVRRAVTMTPLADVDLTAATRDFCRSHGSDPDCAADLSLTMVDAPDPVAAGAEVVYTLRVANAGPAPAQAVRTRLTLPAGLSYAGGSDGCAATGSAVLCDVGFVDRSAAVTRTVRALVAPDLVYVSGGPLDVTASARVENLAGAELDPADDSASTVTRVVAVADLGLGAAALEAAVRRIVIGRDVDATLTVPVTNAGPSSPMDAVVSATASADGGSTAAAPAPIHLTALRTGQPRPLALTFRLGCREPGRHEIRLGLSIRPARAEDDDPNPANDQARSAFVVDCVIPVALNVKPGSAENPANLRSRGVIPTAVLTTAPGEYGLPLAVDATRIDATSVRFGPERLVFEDLGGAAEDHDRGHVEDSYELDERTRDGDRDMVLHFATQASGLTPTDSRACVLGSLAGPRGERYTFFGCDAVRYVP